MSKDQAQLIEAALQKAVLPFAPTLSLGQFATISVKTNKAVIECVFPFPCLFEYELIKQAVLVALQDMNLPQIDINIKQNVQSTAAHNSQSVVGGVKNIIAVASGKGGVGKSTTSVNLALALRAQGASVGLLDADIYGPSQHHMLGVADKRPEMVGQNKMSPIESHGIGLISMGNLVTKQTPIVWRGPMVSGAFSQLVNNAHWGDLDYLIIDMPPGTGDIQLTLSQSIPVSGAVIVTTPQDIALLDAIKGIEMFKKVSVPVLGVVENMATHICTQCGHEEAIFGSGGGKTLANDYNTDVIGQLPLALTIREQTDSGVPPVANDIHSKESRAYLDIALKTSINCWQQGEDMAPAPVISMSDD